MAFSHYEFACILTITITFVMGAFVLITQRKNAVSRSFGMYTLTISAWSFCYFRMITASSPECSLFFARALNIPAAFIPATFLTFTQLLLDNSLAYKQKILRRVFYLAGGIFGLLAFHPLFVAAVVPKMGFNFYIVPGIIMGFFSGWFVITVTITIGILCLGMKRAFGQKRNQIIYVALAYIIGYSGGSLVFLPNYNISLPKFALYCIPLGHGLLFYAIVAHRLLNIRFFIWRASLLFLIYGLLFLVAAPALFYVHKRAPVGFNLNSGYFTFEVAVLSVLLSLGPFLYAYFVRRSVFFGEHARAGLAHELKSPLAAIEGALELVKDAQRFGPAGGRPADYLDIIDRNARRLRATVDSLLVVFTSAEKSNEVMREEVDLGHLAATVTDSFRDLALAKKISLQLEVTGESVLARLEAVKIEQVLSNLLSNAIKFTDQGRVAIKLSQDNTRVTCEVIDTGKGIPADEINFIFDRFFQGKAGRNNKGTGIGLAVAKTWVEAHGGEIFADSAGEGHGSRFWFTLPK